MAADATEDGGRLLQALECCGAVRSLRLVATNARLPVRDVMRVLEGMGALDKLWLDLSRPVLLPAPPGCVQGPGGFAATCMPPRCKTSGARPRAADACG